MSNLRKYRIIIRNLSATTEVVQAAVKMELGDGVEIVGWEKEDTVHYDAPVLTGAGVHQILPHHIHIVLVTYRETKTE